VQGKEWLHKITVCSYDVTM